MGLNTAPTQTAGKLCDPQLQCDEQPQSCWSKAAARPFVLTVDSRTCPPAPPSSQHKPWRQQGRRQARDLKIPHPGMKNWAVQAPWTEVMTHLNGVSVLPAHGQRKGKSIHRQQALNCLRGEALTKVLLCRKVNWGTGRWSARGYTAGTLADFGSMPRSFSLPAECFFHYPIMSRLCMLSELHLSWFSAARMDLHIEIHPKQILHL